MARKRKAGDGTVRQRKDGRWEGRIVIGYDDNGYPKTKNVLAKTKKECLEKLQKLKEECGGLKPEKVRSEMPFGDWLTYWYENHSKPKIRPTTQETYESRIRLHIIPEIGDIPLNKLTQNDLQQFYGRLKKSGRKRFTDKYGEGLSDRMVRMCHATCRSALEKAVQDGLIRVNPAIGCKLPPKKAREMQVLTREELQRFLIQAKFEGYYEVFLLDLATGLRRGELMALQWDDLNFKTGILNVNKQVYDVRGQLQISTPKTKNSVRKIVLPPAVVEVLREYKKTVNSRWMFPSPVKEDCPITPGVVRRRLQLILEHAGCKHIRFHDLRHPYVKHTTKIFSLRLMDFQARLILMLGEKLAELVSFFGEDKAKALSVHSAIESDFHVCHLKRKCLGFYMQSQCAYLTGGLPLAVGDFVVVPVGNRNAEKTGCVTDVFVCSAQDAPYPPEKAKFVLRKSERSAAPEKSET